MIGIGLTKDNPYHQSVKRPPAVLSFDGVDDYVDCGNRESLQNPDAFTIEVKVNASLQSESTGTIISKGVYGTTGNDTFTIDVYKASGGSSYRFFVYPEDSGAANVLNAPITYNKDTIIHGVYDGVEIKLFINGVLQSAMTTTKPMSNSNTITVGSRSTVRFFEGLIYHAKIYTKALTESEITSIINGELIDDSLFLNLPLNEGAGNIVLDKSPNQNNGTVYGATWKY